MHNFHIHPQLLKLLPTCYVFLFFFAKHLLLATLICSSVTDANARVKKYSNVGTAQEGFSQSGEAIYRDSDRKVENL